jgi:aspartate--ammonia ligase
MELYIPEGYESPLGIRETELAIKTVKDGFERKLAEVLNLERVSAPIIVTASSGLNDNLSGVEVPVSFKMKGLDDEIQIVQSLAKWKRAALKRYGFVPGEGLYTDMNAIRKCETVDNLHSIYVDQWDWEMIITKEQRNIEFLKSVVEKIMHAVKQTEIELCSAFEGLDPIISEKVFFITAEELLQLYPNLTPKERENEIAKKHKTVFIIGIGGKLSNGEVHDGRAPDYDDWSMNGDIIIYYPPLGKAVELSSMGIRVDADSLQKQLELANTPERINLPYHRSLIKGEFPLTIGGGIGQSRLCMVLLQKIHVGEVQVSVWPEETVTKCQKAGIRLL